MYYLITSHSYSLFQSLPSAFLLNSYIFSFYHFLIYERRR